MASKLRKMAMAIAMSLMCAVPAFAGPAKDASDQIAKERYDNLVTKSKQMLTRKSKIEKELVDITETLKSLDEGNDVTIPQELSSNCSTLFSGGLYPVR